MARTLLPIASCLPVRTAQRLADLAGRMLFYSSPADRRRSEQNLLSIFGDGLTDAERERIIIRALQNRCKRLVELVHLPRLTESELIDLVVLDASDLEKIAEVRRAKRGVIVVTNHFCNWELLGARWAIEDVNLAVIARLNRFQSIIPRVERAYRAAGFKIIEPNDFRGAMAHLRDNGCLAVLPESHRRRGAVKFDIFGLPIWITRGVALLVVRAKCPIMPAVSVRQPDNRIRGILEPPIPVDYGDRRTAVAAICRALAEILADNIRRYPDNWLWLHHTWEHSSSETTD